MSQIEYKIFDAIPYIWGWALILGIWGVLIALMSEVFGLPAVYTRVTEHAIAPGILCLFPAVLSEPFIYKIWGPGS